MHPPKPGQYLPAFLSPTPLAGQVLQQSHACEDVRRHAGVDVCTSKAVSGGLPGG